jgi:phosphatidylinositol glycan class W
VSAFRGATTLLTALGILAVDFQAFPRRYAKAERHGQGLMDAGVGAVVFAGGLVSKAALADAAASRGA